MKKFIKVVCIAVVTVIVVFFLLALLLLKSCSILSNEVPNEANIGETVTYGNKEITVNFIEIGSYFEGDKSSDNFLKRLDEEKVGCIVPYSNDNLLVSVSYTVKNIGKSTIDVGFGSSSEQAYIIYGEGYEFRNDVLPYSREIHNGKIYNWNNDYIISLEPLSDAKEFRTDIAVPKNVIEDTETPLNLVIYGHSYNIER